jgi:hypothetical protein
MKSKTKRCPGCKHHLPRNAASFGRNRAHPDGLNSYCKRCCVEIPRKRRLEHKSSARAIADAQLLTEQEFWADWQELLSAFAVDDNAFVARHGQLFRTDPRCLSWSDGRSARMENRQ